MLNLCLIEHCFALQNLRIKKPIQKGDFILKYKDKKRIFTEEKTYKIEKKQIRFFHKL